VSDLEAMAAALAATGDYRVLQRLRPHEPQPIPEGTDTRLGLFVDCETTGLDPAVDEIIELAMVPFVYGLDGRIFEVGEPFVSLRQPTRTPISAEIAALTGITREMVDGHVINPADVSAFAEPAALVIAHHADFDRRFVEQLSPVFASKPWACSMSEIDWKAEGFDAGAKLAYLAMQAGFFYERHRAVHDCNAAIKLLSTMLQSGVPAMARLLERCRRPSWRISATNSPFAMKDRLKARGYRWDAGKKVWWTDVADDKREAEVAFLRADIYGRAAEFPVRELTAWDRFSDRA
jgi:DNA polymerase III subunit epsilon